MADPGLEAATLTLATRLARADTGAAILLTGVETDIPDVLGAEVPDEASGSVRGFLDAVRPDVCVHLGCDLRPALIEAAAGRGTRLILVSGNAPPPGGLRGRGARAVIQRFGTTLATGRRGQAHLEALGAKSIATIGPLADVPEPPSCNESEREDLARLIGRRPRWFAVGVPALETGTLVSAHRGAAALSHRLLMILRPEGEEAVPPIRARFDAAGLRTALRSEGAEPDPEVQIYIADTPDEDGLWYRLAPVTLFGGSFSRDVPVVSPWAAASLGSAILHGPMTGVHAAAFSRLAAAGAARLAPRPEKLGEVLSGLLAPDVAARAAHAGWNLISAGSGATEHVADLVLDALDAPPGP